MSGLLATAAALIGGIPVALWIDRLIKAAEERKQRLDERRRELELLELLREELTFTSAALAARRAQPALIQPQPMKSDLWAAVSAAGKLNLIRNHRLLNRITSAYYVVNVVRRIEELAYRAARSGTVRFASGQTAVDFLMQDARHFDELLDASIREAIREIDEESAKAV